MMSLNRSSLSTDHIFTDHVYTSDDIIINSLNRRKEEAIANEIIFKILNNTESVNYVEYTTDIVCFRLAKLIRGKWFSFNKYKGISFDEFNANMRHANNTTSEICAILRKKFASDVNIYTKYILTDNTDIRCSEIMESYGDDTLFCRYHSKLPPLTVKSADHQKIKKILADSWDYNQVYVQIVVTW